MGEIRELVGYRMASPIGELLVGHGPGPLLRWLVFPGGRGESSLQEALVAANSVLLEQPPAGDVVAAQLSDYFAGRSREFTVDVEPAGTAFQRAVWNALQAIPYGMTISYTELAERVGVPKAVRAVGSANGQNPISIVIPCHRVIGKDGSLTGYGGGIERKRALLRLEGAPGQLELL